MKTCKHCKKQVTFPHDCKIDGGTIKQEDSGDFATSMMIGAATDNALLGGLLGGDMAGGILGDLINDGELFDSD